MPLLFAACDNATPAPTNTLSINFSNKVGNEALVIDTRQYSREAATFSISAFKYYISNVELLNTDGDLLYTEADSYHLIAESGFENKLSFDLKELPAMEVATLRFSIGVDAEANAKTDNPGDLDPSNEMAWNWDTGYKFVLLEGELFIPDKERKGLVFHIGGDENYKTVALDAMLTLKEGNNVSIDISTNILGMFTAPDYVSFEAVNVAMGGDEATKIANNYEQNLFTIESINN